jgi:hypothetical protein
MEALTTTFTLPIQVSRTVASIATVILEEVSLDALSLTGLRTMAVASKPQLGTMMRLVVTMEGTVEMVDSPVEPFNVRHSTQQMVHKWTSPSVATM